MENGGQIKNQITTSEQYKEWKRLILEAKKIGLQPHEIRGFFQKATNKTK